MQTPANTRSLTPAVPKTILKEDRAGESVTTLGAAAGIGITSNAAAAAS